MAESTMSNQAAATDDVYLWLLPDAAVDSFIGGLGGRRLLTAEEQARMDRLMVAPARRKFLAGRLLCRYALTVRTGRPLDGWRFSTGPHGRPEPEPDPDGVRFSLSRTDGLIVCAVTQGRVCGVDVESPPASLASAGHLSCFFAPVERAELAALAPAARIARVNELWVLKEAYLKALGTGMRRALDGFSFPPRPAGGTGRITVHDPELPGGWWFDLLRYGPGHLVALAVEGARPGRLHRTDLTGL